MSQKSYKKRKNQSDLEAETKMISVFAPSLYSGMICDSYVDFVYEVKPFIKKNDPQRHVKLCSFGRNLYPSDKIVGFRHKFSADHFLQRISLFLIDCTAHLDNDKMTFLRGEFLQLFPEVRAATVLGGYTRIISTGSLLTIITSLLHASKNEAKISKKLLTAQTFPSAQYTYKEKYVVFASALIELFYLRQIRVKKCPNSLLNYGLFLATKPNVGPDSYLCCGFNYPTHYSSTACGTKPHDDSPNYDTDDESLENKQIATKIDNSVEYVNGLKNGIFGLPYYINSVARIGGSPNVDLFEKKGSIVCLYDSNKGQFTGESFLIDVTYVQLRSRNSKGKVCHHVGDEVLWKYHNYA